MSPRRREAALVTAALGDFVELVIVGVRAGLSPTAAVTEASASVPAVLRPATDEVVHRVGRGILLADALGALVELAGPAAATIVDTLGSAERYGLALEPVLDRLATDVRDQRRRASETFARTLPVRLAFPLVVCTLPAFVLLAIVPALLGAISTLSRSGL